MYVYNIVSYMLVCQWFIDDTAPPNQSPPGNVVPPIPSDAQWQTAMGSKAIMLFWPNLGSPTLDTAMLRNSCAWPKRPAETPLYRICVM